jgi:DNA-binding transcriptional regulator YdaS (Cro superfamily)
MNESSTRLKHILDTEGRRQTWLADQLGVGRSIMCQWCSGHKKVPQHRRAQIAKALGRNESDVFPDAL